MNNSVDIKTTDSQILIKTDGKANYSGFAKNSVWYSPEDATIKFYLKDHITVLGYAFWGNVTVNGETLTKDNYQELLEALFI